jgi:chromosome partitioning protein
VRVAATYSIKGGVGKTSTAVNLALEAARNGVRVLVWDLDPQGGATFLLRVRPKLRGGSKRLVGARGELAAHVRGSDLPGVHVVPADFSLRHLDLHLGRGDDPGTRLAALLTPLRDTYDLALLDCPPSISLASESVFGAADALLVPVVPATLASRTLRQLTDFLQDDARAPRVLPFLSMVDRRRKLQRDLVDQLFAEWPSLLPTVIPASAVIERMGAERAPVGDFARSAPASRAYRALWADVAGALWPDVTVDH